MDDLDAVLAVGHRTWPATYEGIAGADYVQAGLAKWWSAEATSPAIRQGRLTVAELDGEVVGMASVGREEDHLVLWRLYVLPEHHGQGIGSALLATVLEEAARQVRRDPAVLHRGQHPGRALLPLQGVRRDPPRGGRGRGARPGLDVAPRPAGSGQAPAGEADPPPRPTPQPATAPADTEGVQS